MLITAARRLSRDSLARNSLLIMATTVSNGGLGYLYWMLAARSVPPNRIGTATAVISAATAVSMIANLGAGHMFIQRLPGSDTATWSRIVGSGLLLGSVATAATAVTAALVVPALSGNFAFLTGLGGVAALTAGAVAVTLTTLLDNLYVAHRSGHGMLVRNLAVAVGKTITLIMVLAAGFHGAGAVLVSYILPTLLVSAVTVGAGPRRLRPGARWSLTGLRTELPHVRAALTGHHLINLTQAGPAALLPVLVTARLGADANAHFYLAWMTASMLFMVSPAVASALYAERTNSAPVGVLRAAVVVLAVVGAPAAVLLLAGDRILALFSAGYAAEGAVLLQVLVLAAVPDAVANLAVAHWRSRGEFGLCRRLNLVRAVTCMVLAWVLLPGAGVTGAGIAWLTGQTAAAVLVAAIALTRRHRPPTASPDRCIQAPHTAPPASPPPPASPDRGVSVRDAAPPASPPSPASPDRGVSVRDAALGASPFPASGEARPLLGACPGGCIHAPDAAPPASPVPSASGDRGVGVADGALGARRWPSASGERGVAVPDAALPASPAPSASGDRGVGVADGALGASRWPSASGDRGVGVADAALPASPAPSASGEGGVGVSDAAVGASSGWAGGGGGIGGADVTSGAGRAEGAVRVPREVGKRRQAGGEEPTGGNR